MYHTWVLRRASFFLQKSEPKACKARTLTYVPHPFLTNLEQILPYHAGGFLKRVYHTWVRRTASFFSSEIRAKGACKAGTLTLLTEKCITLFFATICLRITITKVEFFCSKAFPAGILSNSTKAVHCIFFCINHFIFFCIDICFARIIFDLWKSDLK